MRHWRLPACPLMCGLGPAHGGRFWQHSIHTHRPTLYHVWRPQSPARAARRTRRGPSTSRRSGFCTGCSPQTPHPVFLWLHGCRQTPAARRTLERMVEGFDVSVPFRRVDVDVLYGDSQRGRRWSEVATGVLGSVVCPEDQAGLGTGRRHCVVYRHYGLMASGAARQNERQPLPGEDVNHVETVVTVQV